MKRKCIYYGTDLFVCCICGRVFDRTRMSNDGDACQSCYIEYR